MKSILNPIFLKRFFIGGLILMAIPFVIISYKVIKSGGESVVIDIGGMWAYMIYLFYVVLAFALSAIAVGWMYQRVLSLLNIRSAKMKVELMHLQNQVNPHFFFNVLNNLYGLIDKDSTKAKEMIVSLSEMMRYSIYEGQNEQVPLEKDLAFLEQVIQLNQMRYHKKVDVQFEKNLSSEDIKITPLLLVILVENAFKHGVERLTKDAYVYIKVESSADELIFSISNNFDPEEQTTTNGVGLANLKRRLELVYAKKHHLDIQKTESEYNAVLTLKLK